MSDPWQPPSGVGTTALPATSRDAAATARASRMWSEFDSVVSLVIGLTVGLMGLTLSARADDPWQTRWRVLVAFGLLNAAVGLRRLAKVMRACR